MRGRIPAVLALLLAAAAATFGLLGLPATAYASEPGSPAASTGSFDRMSSFTAEYVLDAEGGATVTETIDYVFGTSSGVKHGILRNIVTRQAVTDANGRASEDEYRYYALDLQSVTSPTGRADPDEGDRPVGRRDPDPGRRPRRHRQRLRDVRPDVPPGQRHEPVPRPRGVLLQRLPRRLGPEGHGQGDRHRAGWGDRRSTASAGPAPGPRVLAPSRARPPCSRWTTCSATRTSPSRPRCRGPGSVSSSPTSARPARPTTRARPRCSPRWPWPAGSARRSSRPGSWASSSRPAAATSGTRA